MRRFSFFEVPSDFSTDILTGLENASWNGNKVTVEISQIPSSKSSNNKRTKAQKLSGERKKNSNKSWNGKRAASKNPNSKRKNNRTSSIIGAPEKGVASFKARFNASNKRKNRA